MRLSAYGDARLGSRSSRVIALISNQTGGPRFLGYTELHDAVRTTKQTSRLRSVPVVCLLKDQLPACQCVGGQCVYSVRTPLYATSRSQYLNTNVAVLAERTFSFLALRSSSYILACMDRLNAWPTHPIDEISQHKVSRDDTHAEVRYRFTLKLF